MRKSIIRTALLCSWRMPAAARLLLIRTHECITQPVLNTDLLYEHTGCKLIDGPRLFLLKMSKRHGER